VFRRVYAKIAKALPRDKHEYHRDEREKRAQGRRAIVF